MDDAAVSADLLAKIQGVRQSNGEIVARLEQLKPTSVPRLQFKLSPSLPLNVEMFEWQEPVADILTAWRPSADMVLQNVADPQFSAQVLLSKIGNYDDVARLNGEIGDLAEYIATYMHQHKAALFLRTVLHNMEVLQVCLGEIEGCVIDPNNDILAVTKQVAIVNDALVKLKRMPNLCKPQRLHFRSGSRQSLVNNTASIVSADCVETFDKGVVFWEFTLRYNSHTGCSSCIGVKNPNPGSEDYYGFNWRKTGDIAGLKNSEDDGNYHHALPVSGNHVFQVTLNFTNSTLSVFTDAWGTSLSFDLPPGRAWRPDFSIRSGSITLLE